jgi:pyridoxal 5'-phosphate synthase pdxT subunit
MRIGVLALQGDWQAHAAALARAGGTATPVRTAAKLAEVDALILPGGESTTMLNLLDRGGMTDSLRARIADGLPVLATCAGIILLAREVNPPQRSLGLLDVAIERNAYGRQLASAVVEIRTAAELGGEPTMEGVFIRAPRVLSAGRDVKVLGWREEDPVLLEQGAVLAATFHPELTDDDRVQRRFLRRIGGNR